VDCDCRGQCCPAANVKESLVRVRRGAASGSGTVVWSDGSRSVVLTAWHVIEAGAGEVGIRAGGKWHAGELLAKDEPNDLAAVLVGAGLTATPVATTGPAVGDEVCMVGVTSIFSRGKVSAVESARYLIGDPAAGPDYSDGGDSGAGVFFRGKLVGVHQGKASDSPNAPGTPYCANLKVVAAFAAAVFKDGKPVAPAVAKSPANPAAAPPFAPAQKRIIGYTCGTDRYGRRVCVPVYEP
jgi:S1-C subfamily serine protease